MINYQIINYMFVIFILLLVIGIGFISSNISFFLQWLYKWNFIGQKWMIILRWLRTKIKRKQNKKSWDVFCSVLGYCVYCQSTWIAILLCIYLIGFNIIYIIMCMGTNYFFIEKFNKFLYPKYY
jgi:hypothetical protein